MHEQGDEKALQREIDDLKKRLRRAQRNNPLIVLMFLLMMKKIQATDNDQELHLVSPFPMKRSIFTKGGAGVHPEGE